MPQAFRLLYFGEKSFLVKILGSPVFGQAVVSPKSSEEMQSSDGETGL
jgi:hypothetical protein